VEVREKEATLDAVDIILNAGKGGEGWNIFSDSTLPSLLHRDRRLLRVEFPLRHRGR
jgi:hypothetical protein